MNKAEKKNPKTFQTVTYWFPISPPYRWAKNQIGVPMVRLAGYTRREAVTKLIVWMEDNPRQEKYTWEKLKKAGWTIQKAVVSPLKKGAE